MKLKTGDKVVLISLPSGIGNRPLEVGDKGTVEEFDEVMGLVEVKFHSSKVWTSPKRLCRWVPEHIKDWKRRLTS